MTWTKREAVTDLFILGDEDGQHKKIGGLLVGMPFDQGYKEKVNYRITKKDGETVTVSGSATLARQISETDVGKFVRLEFTGWGKSANGKYKVIEVSVYEGEVTPEMKAWPGYAELAASRGNGSSKAAGKTTASNGDFDGGPIADDSDDLPF